MACEHCIDPDGDACYPSHGLAPHTHENQDDPANFDVDGWIGSTKFLPESEWPDSFVVDPESPGTHGTWYCPYCRAGLDI